MKKSLFVFSMLVLTFIFLNGCSSTLPEVQKASDGGSSIYENNLRINVKQIYSWINRMPGSPPRFHVSGELELLDNSKYDIANTTIKRIIIIQSKNTIYQFTPKFEIKMDNDKKSILFSTIRGLLVSAILEADKTINVEIELSDSANDIKYLIPNVYINEVH